MGGAFEVPKAAVKLPGSPPIFGLREQHRGFARMASACVVESPCVLHVDRKLTKHELCGFAHAPECRENARRIVDGLRL